ncbi:Uncharacterised protein [Vibrio cholerae]|uniref:Uncharacterized protein n=1 Tax=Vibrio cholerae TaxID=666 RepID=A0A655T1Q0_VIBCL|nr:Uncharacterised protein [Vibrio cholerae]CSD20401.1 Uncharacterised protein [Vibrio cholerae]
MISLASGSLAACSCRSSLLAWRSAASTAGGKSRTLMSGYSLFIAAQLVAFASIAWLYISKAATRKAVSKITWMSFGSVSHFFLLTKNCVSEPGSCHAV